MFISQRTLIRFYPLWQLFITRGRGPAGSDNQGLMGLEKYYDKELNGDEGHVRFFADAKGQRMPNVGDDFKKTRSCGLNLEKLNN